MRRRILILGLAGLLGFGGLFLSGCERLDTPFGRNGRGGATGRGSGLTFRDSSSTSGNATATPDTIIWASVVKVPDGYDWKRDTLAGRFSGELLFYRGAQPCLSIPLGGTLPVSPDPGTHHIIDGHLYTECCSGGALHILRDGEPFLHLPGEGFLKGLLAGEDGTLWTLACAPGEGSLTLRRDSETIVRIARGSAIGGLGESRPALYEDDASICFSYTEGGNMYAVRGGGIVPIPPPEDGAVVEDFRWWGGEAVTLYKKGGGHCLYTGGAGRDGSGRLVIYGRKAARLVEAGGRLFAFGMSDFGLRDIAFAVAIDGSGTQYFYGNDPWLHWSEQGLFTVQGSGPLRICLGTSTPTSSNRIAEIEGPVVFTDECVASIGRDAFLGVSVPGGHPLLMRGGTAVGEFPFDGYITAVDVELSLPSL